MRHDPIKYILHTLWAILGVTILIFLALVTQAKAFEAGQVRSGPFWGCDTHEDAKAFFVATVTKTLDTSIPTTCGPIQGLRHEYMKELDSVSVPDGKLTFHVVRLLDLPGQPEQYVVTFLKLAEM